ncbi:hypothetical protein DAEQUDRAFT_179315 [Daedalea quercina L-15889]|uniref:DUF6534 domain-containing protein n=1 Tax=Daedalea quercina L-15889 TaxID=1314783 RepID=A0A165RE64_9APHY|nr:hypothetical protein DAEQUDRAFT_179315 [Daedalea quercina L-15889]
MTRLQVFLHTNLASSVVVDVLIAMFLCWNLQHCRALVGSTRTNCVINSLMVYSAVIGFVTSFCALLCLMLYALLPPAEKFAFVAIYFILPKLLLNSLLATLNGRKPMDSVVNIDFPSVCSRRTVSPSQ